MSSRLAADPPEIGQPTARAGATRAGVAGELELAPAAGANGAGAQLAADTDGEGRLNAQRDAPVGGQAVLEGVMMRGVSNWAVAVRKPSPEQLAEGERSPEEAALGEIDVSVFPLDSAMKRHRLLRLPVVRGVVALGGSLMIGFRALEVSANAQLPPEENERGSRRACGRGRSSSRSRSRSSCSS